MTTIIERLEAAAIAAHRRGDTWVEFHRDMNPLMRAAEPISRERYHRMADRLLALLVSGDVDGHHPPGDDAPWATDDAADAMETVSDTGTQAYFSWANGGWT